MGLSALFSASETAFTSLKEDSINNMLKEDYKRAKIVSQLSEDNGKFLSSVLVGNNIVNITASAIATSIAIKHFGHHGVGISTGILTVLILVFCEITPKTLASKNPDKVSLVVARPIKFFAILLAPISLIFNYITNKILCFFGTKLNKNNINVNEKKIIDQVPRQVITDNLRVKNN